MNKRAASQYSLIDKPGWLTLNPGTGKTHILHKEARHHYAIVTKIDIDATANGHEAGIYLTNGNESVSVEVYSGYNNAKVLGYRFGSVTYEEENPLGNELWLKVERFDHKITCYYGSNGINWKPIGNTISVTGLDKGQENYNWWVGTSDGLYASKTEAHFDSYAFKDGFSDLPLIGYNNYFGLETSGSGINKAMTNSTSKGGWIMLGGVELGNEDRVAERVTVQANASYSGQLEVWIDDLENDGTMIATIAIEPKVGDDKPWHEYSTELSNISGQHDIYLRWKGVANAFNVKSIRFFANDSFYTGIDKTFKPNNWKAFPNPFKNSFTIITDKPGTSFSIFSLDGRMVESGSVEHSNQTLGQFLDPGLYLLKYQSSVIKLNKIK
jgi:xylan 1,4-beta-xylosidase